MWHFSKAFGSKNYRLAICGQKHLATGFAISSKMTSIRMLSCRPTAGIGLAVVFGRPFVRGFALCNRTVVCLSCLSVYDVGVLWPNGWIDQDETWHGIGHDLGHIVLDGYPAPLKRGQSSPFSAHVHCGQTAGWIKMPLGMEEGLGRSDFVLSPSPKKRGNSPPILGPCRLWRNGWINQTPPHKTGTAGDSLLERRPFVES